MRIAVIAQIAFVAVACVLVYSFVRAAQSDHKLNNCAALCEMRPNYAGSNRRLPDFEVENLAGQTVSIHDYVGRKPFIINFWSKHCEPCLDEMPTLNDMADLVSKSDVKVLAITIDELPPDEVKKTASVVLKQAPINFEILIDRDQKVMKGILGAELVPETWYVDTRGIIRVRVDGPRRDWTGPFELEVLEMIGRPSSCQVDFHTIQKRDPRTGKEFPFPEATGKFAYLCKDYE